MSFNWFHSNAGLVTKKDLAEAEARIIKAINAVNDARLSALSEGLKASTDSLQVSVEQNQNKGTSCPTQSKP